MIILQHGLPITTQQQEQILVIGAYQLQVYYQVLKLIIVILIMDLAKQKVQLLKETIPLFGQQQRVILLTFGVLTLGIIVIPDWLIMIKILL